MNRSVGDGASAAGSNRCLTAQVEQVFNVPPRLRRELYRLYATYYDGTSPDRFLADFKEKQFVLLLRELSGTLGGFSTLAVIEAEINNQPLRAIFSGDTIIERRYWGTQALAANWIRFAGAIKAQATAVPLFWFLIVKGHRTFRYLPAFAIEFFPHWLGATPPWACAIIDGLAAARFGDRYDRGRGIVSFAEPRDRLKAPWARVEAHELRRPEVAFFVARNPGYLRGDELVCLTELSPANLRPIARKLFTQGLEE